MDNAKAIETAGDLAMRDWFAGQSLNGSAFQLAKELAAEGSGVVDPERTANSVKGLVFIAYLIADTALAARKATP